jgi:ABC-type nickel/cobalt efflux system permease component RcnA
MSLYVTVFAGTAPLGGLFAGAVAQAFGAPVAFSLGAGLAVTVLAVVAWRLRSVRMPRAAGFATEATVAEEPEAIATQAA